jgi:N-methylhydantoinase B
MRAGDAVVVRTPGGGGYGRAFERDPDRVAHDLRRGYFTPAEASELYGVVLGRDGVVDESETARLRGQD